MSYSQYFLHNLLDMCSLLGTILRNIQGLGMYSPHSLMDMGSLLGIIFWTLVNYKKDHYVHCG